MDNAEQNRSIFFKKIVTKLLSCAQILLSAHKSFSAHINPPHRTQILLTAHKSYHLLNKRLSKPIFQLK